MRLRSMRW